MGNTISTKYKNYCSKNEDSFFCSCYRYNDVDDSWENMFECYASWMVYGFVITGSIVILGAALELLDFIPDVLDVFEDAIDLIAQLFSNFQFLGSWADSLAGPFTSFLAKMVELFQNFANFIRETFPNTDEKLVNVMISEIAALLLLKTWQGVEKEAQDWKGSVGYNIFQVLDAPFRKIKDSLNSHILRFLFNLVTLPMQTTIFLICVGIDFIENLF